MQNPHLKKLLQRKMTRKEFLIFGGVAVASLFGVGGVIRMLSSQAASPFVSTEPENGTKTGPVTVITDSTASGGKNLKFGPTPTGNPRDSLVYGTYVPGVLPTDAGYQSFMTANTAGLLNPTGVTITRERGTDGYIYIDTVPTGGVISNTLFKGKVKVRTAGGGVGSAGQVTFKNCKFVGRPPEQLNSSGNANGGCVENFGTNPPHLIFIDCLFDNQWWYDNGLSSLKGSPLATGLHGGNADFYRCEIKNLQDCINYVGPNTDTPALAASCVVQGCVFWKNYYLSNWTSTGVGFAPSSDDTHSDSFQFNTGRNITIKHNFFGGRRDMTGYDALPNGYNSGTDAHNSCIMIQQEAGTAVNQLVRNVMIDGNWFSGGAATINIYYKNSNTGSDWTFKNNKIAQRGSTQYAGSGYVIYLKTPMTPVLSNNVSWDPLAGSINGTGTAAPVFTY